MGRMVRAWAMRLGLAVLLCSLTFAACGGSEDSVSEEELEQATKAAEEKGREEAENEAELAELREEVDALRQKQRQESSSDDSAPASTPPPPAPSPADGITEDVDNCGAGVYARSGTTTCGFALNVASDYFNSPANNFRSISPTTGESYAMTCAGTAPVVCTGGNDAAVYIP